MSDDDDGGGSGTKDSGQPQLQPPWPHHRLCYYWLALEKDCRIAVQLARFQHRPYIFNLQQLSNASFNFKQQKY